jgi:hypothetical protein
MELPFPVPVKVVKAEPSVLTAILLAGSVEEPD